LLCWAVSWPAAVEIALFGAFAGSLSSLSDSWVLIARKQFGRVAAVEWSSRLVYVAVLLSGLALVASPFVVPFALLAGAVAGFAASLLLCGDETGTAEAVGGTRYVSTAELVRTGLPATIARLATTAYGNAAPVLLSGSLPVTQIGVYSASDRVVRVIQAAANPLSTALFPSMSSRSGDAGRLAQTSRVVALQCAAVATVLAGLVALLAPVAIRLLYGGSFDEAASLLRVQVFLLPGAVGTTILLTTFYTVLGRTGLVLLITLVGVVCAGVGLVLAAHSGSAFSFVIAGVIAESCTFLLGLALVPSTVRRVNLDLINNRVDSDSLEDPL
jgi:O-antigen/teichoic acid export membrane protein